MKNLGLGDLSVLAYGLNLAGYWPPCFKAKAPWLPRFYVLIGNLTCKLLLKKQHFLGYESKKIKKI